MFTDEQKKELGKPLNPANVKPPAPGKYGEYIEGWKVIEEANRIFGFDGWSRETVEIVEVCRYETEVGRDRKPGWAVGYRAKVRVTIYGGELDTHNIVREGSAVGNGVSVQLYDAIESAAKEAETDAMKRAMMTLGYPFGLALYDKSKANVGVEPDCISEDQRAELMAMMDALNVPVAEFLQVGNLTDLRELLVTDFDTAKRWINKKARERAAQKETA